MSKEIAQTVGTKRMAWLIALIAAFAVFATVGSQFGGANAAVAAGPATPTQTPASGNVIAGGVVTFVGTANVDLTLNAANSFVQVNAPAGYTITNTVCALGTAVAATTAVNTGITSGKCDIGGTATTAGTITATVTMTAPVTLGAAAGATATVSDGTVTSTSASASAGYTIVAGVAVPTAVAAQGSTGVVTFSLPAGITYCTDATASGAGARINGAANTAFNPALVAGEVSTPATQSNNAVGTHTVTGAPIGQSITLNLHAAGTASGVGCATTAVTVTVVLAELRHMADDGTVITAKDINSNVRGSSHAICAVAADTTTPVLIPQLSVQNFIINNGGGYAGALASVVGPQTPTFTDPFMFTGNGSNGGLNGATCLWWLSTGAGDQQISATYLGNDAVNYSIDFDTNDSVVGQVNDALVKEWNVLEGSTLSGGVSGANVPPALTVAVAKNVPLTLNPSTGAYQFTLATINDVFFGSHQTSANTLQSIPSLAGVAWTVSLTAGSCGTLGATALTGTTTLLTNGTVGGTPAVAFAQGGTLCTPSSTAQIVITGREAGNLGSGNGIIVTETINLTFSTVLTTKQVFLAWAGQRVILEHDWRIAPGDVDGLADGLPLVNNVATDPDPDPVGTCLGYPAIRTDQSSTFVVQYIKGSGPGNFLPALGAAVQGNDNALVTVQANDDSQTDVDDIILEPQGSCISRVLYESEDPGEVDIEAFIQNAGASKVAFVVYYMKLNTVNVSLVTQVSKPTHNSSIVSDYSAGNPWDASKDAAENKADWNVSKDLLVRGRVTGWFTNTNPSGRAADTSNPLNVLPANRWVMPNDWPLLAGGPADPADGTDAKGTAEYFRPEYDIMFAPNNTAGVALSSPTGVGFTFITTVAAAVTAKTAPAGTFTVVDGTSLPASGTLIVGTYVITYSRVGNTITILSFSQSVGSSLAAPTSMTVAAGTPVYVSSGVPFEGPFSLLDIPGLAASGLGGAALSDIDPNNIRDTNLPDGDVDWWDAPMPPSLVTVDIRGTGFIKQVIKSDVYYNGTANVLPQTYPNAFYVSDIPDSPFIAAVVAGGGYFWDTFGSDGPGCTPNTPFLCAYNVAATAANGQGAYPFWAAIPFFQAGTLGTNPFNFVDATMTSSNIAELAQIQGAYGDITIDRTIVVYSDNHGEFMVTANGDLKTDLTACSTNALGGGKHCKTGDKVGTGNITATADYPDFRGKHFPVLSNTATVTWLWGGYKDVTVEAGETDQYKYVVFHAMDRDGMCLGSTYSIELHPVLTALDAAATNKINGTSLANAGDPDETVDFLIDSGEGIILARSDAGSTSEGKQFATKVPTYSIAYETAIASGKKMFPLSSLAATGQTDECQSWIKVSNSLLGILNVLVIADDDEGKIGFDKIIDLTNTTSYTLNFRWSLVTWAGANNIAVADALKGTGTSGKNPGGNDISASVTAIYGWDQAAQQWLGYFPSGVNVPGANDLTALKDGSAYWIAITGPGSVTWTIASNVD